MDIAQYARVIKFRNEEKENLVGKANNNPILDTREYIIEFMDGHEETMNTYFPRLMMMVTARYYWMK